MGFRQFVQEEENIFHRGMAIKIVSPAQIPYEHVPCFIAQEIVFLIQIPGFVITTRVVANVLEKMMMTIQKTWNATYQLSMQ